MELETYMRSFYLSLCNMDEILRIENPQNADDYLLKLRANATVEHVRIFRVFLARMRRQGSSWSFSNSFSKLPFENVKSFLDHEDFEKVKDIAAGFVFCNKPNGSIMNTKFGNVISISLSLRYFLYFMNLAFLEFDGEEIPGDARTASIKIAIRTMLQNESLDFDLDPRGIIPTPVLEQLDFQTDRQLEFVIAHEYSHFLLGHLDERKIVEEPLFDSFDSNSFSQKIFSYSQQDELAADIDALSRPIHTPDSRKDMLSRALFFFVYLDIYQDVKDQISPSFNRFRTHPAPMDRFENLLHRFRGEVEIDQENLSNLLEFSKHIKESLSEDVSLNIESYEQYGSIYLGSWRGKTLVDHVDY
ncbi:TPA: hypothetical protein N2C06_002806 [Pseudomonas aeruginosa]|nr:hypothetical protein [Pseudomonas aeruginosa]